MNYKDLEELLVKKDFQEADILTYNKLCQLAKVDIKKRKWLYFTDINKISSEDLRIIDQLWRIHSNNQFGFSVQRQIWLNINKDWEKYWEIIGWKKNKSFRIYPNEFIWNTNSPKGHLPLLNQLRGIQVLLHLFSHQAWEN